MNIGVYVIRNIINNRRYVGSTSKLDKRWSQHKCSLNSGNHFNPYLQNAWKKYGAKCFVYEIVEKCPVVELLVKEEYWIKSLDSFKEKNGYNMCQSPRASRLGCKSTNETIQKMKISLGGKNHPMWGKHLKRQTKKKLREVQLGVSKPTSGVRKKFVLKNPSGELVEIFGMRKFCRENNICHSMLWRVANNKQKEYNGWTN